MTTVTHQPNEYSHLPDWSYRCTVETTISSPFNEKKLSPLERLRLRASGVAHFFHKS